MIGVGPGVLDAGNVGQISQRGRRLECVDEIGEACAVSEQDRRVRRLLRDIHTRHRAKELLADDPAHGRERRLQGVDEPAHHVVAIDRESPLARLAVRPDQTGRQWTLGIEQRPGEAVLPFGEPRHDAGGFVGFVGFVLSVLSVLFVPDCGHGCLRALRLGLYHWPGRNVGIPLDQRGRAAEAPNGMRVQAPDDFVDTTVMRVDEQWPPFFVGFPCVAGQMDLLDVGERIVVDIGYRILLLIGR